MKNSIRTGIFIFSFATASVAAIFSLYLTSTFNGKGLNNFNRKFISSPLSHRVSIDIQYNSYYPAGEDSTTFYLGNRIDPLHLLKVRISDLDTQQVRLRIKNMAHSKLAQSKLFVNPPFFYLVNGDLPALFRGKIDLWEADRFMSDSVYFTEAVPLSSHSFAIRSLTKKREYVLGKESDRTPHLKLTPGLLEKQIDGIFCTDGILQYAPDLSMVIYVYYYRNEFICADTNLNLIYRGRTIDTIHHAQIKVASIASENSLSIAAPPLTTNKNNCVAGDKLFIHSGLVADNEDLKKYKDSSAIDAYNLKTGNYIFSFYIPNHKGKKMSSFRVFDNQLVAIHDNYLSIYNFNPTD